jgi:membrane protein DedA with SNARE-associated domain/rhodanese-related sulfurtransferase
MSQFTEFIVRHGQPLVFGAVLVDQLGIPLPAVPWLLAAGALSATGKFNFLSGLGATLLACLLADGMWFYLGRYRGNQVVGFLCRVSLEPDSCVRRTQNVFTRYGLPGLVAAKFLPGMSTVAPPLAGMSGLRADRFLLVDGFGSLLYGASFLSLGYFFSSQIDQIGSALARLGGGALRLILVCVVLYTAYKYWQRRRLLHELSMARITTTELRQKIDAGENLVLLDLRSSAALKEDPFAIEGAVHMNLEDLDRRLPELPRDRDIVVYCSCPNEESSARVALRLQRRGFQHVRPLLGGIDAWRRENPPPETVIQKQP